MLLAIDVGNTNSVFAVVNDGIILNQWRAATVTGRTADEYAAWISQLLALDDLSIRDCHQAVISTVVPHVLFDLKQMCRRYLQTEAIVVRENAHVGIDVRVERADEVGADRLVNAVGAHMEYSGPLIVIDFGTATTFDIIDADGAFSGGVIAPGVNLNLKALHMAAAQLPHIDVKKQERVIGQGTVTAIRSGVYWGYVSLVEGMVARIKQEYGANMTVIGTGGLAAVFRDGTDIFDHLDDNITIRGLVEIHRRTESRAGRA